MTQEDAATTRRVTRARRVDNLDVRRRNAAGFSRRTVKNAVFSQRDKYLPDAFLVEDIGGPLQIAVTPDRDAA